ncbi:CPBP family intramembrane glutamic endopeptidase [Niallia sp. XMNu-256]|uniref:CPBP family intramembrane glutamic endopeptidase n=1 Tax=Niallia sp. XMNu-256 TaxID=3082444 RepID=UPI0030CF11A9
MKKIDVKIALLLSAICVVGTLILVPNQMETLQLYLNPSDYAKLMEEMPFSIPVLTVISSIQIFIMSFIIAFLGLKIGRKSGFSFAFFETIFEKGKKVIINRHSLALSLLFGAITGFILVGADKFYFQQNIPQLASVTPETSITGMFAGIFYGGVFEEVLMRLFIMSLFVWIINKVITRGIDSIPNWVYGVSIVIAALLFAVGHFPATIMYFGELNSTIIFRSLLLNGIGGLFFGYLYWKKGLEYAIFAHMFAHISVQLLFYPIFY